MPRRYFQKKFSRKGFGCWGSGRVGVLYPHSESLKEPLRGLCHVLG